MWLTGMKHVAVDSGEPQSVEELWKEYFADPTQWWDNRADKVWLDKRKRIQYSAQQVTGRFLLVQVHGQLLAIRKATSMKLRCWVEWTLLRSLQCHQQIFLEYWLLDANWIWDSFLGSDHGLWCLQRNPRSPDFRHKVARKALWIDGWSTPPWVKAVLKLVTEGKLQPPIDYRTKDSQDTTQGNR